MGKENEVTWVMGKIDTLIVICQNKIMTEVSDETPANELSKTETSGDNDPKDSKQSTETSSTPLGRHERWALAVQDKDIAISAFLGNAFFLLNVESASKTVEITQKVIADGGNLKEAIQTAATSGDPVSVAVAAVGATLAFAAPLAFYARDRAREATRRQQEDVI